MPRGPFVILVLMTFDGSGSLIFTVGILFLFVCFALIVGSGFDKIAGKQPNIHKRSWGVSVLRYIVMTILGLVLMYFWLGGRL